MRLTTTVLLSRDVLHLVCKYQCGIYEDMRPFLSLRVASTADDTYSDVDEEATFSALQEMASAVELIFPAWLASFSMDRLWLLFDCIDGVREPILAWAASTARLDVLVWVHEQYNIHECSSKLLVAGVRQLSVLAYLQRINYRNNLEQAAIEAAVQGLVPNLSLLMTELQTPTDWLDGRTVSRIAHGGHRPVLEYLLPQLVLHPDLLVRATTYAAAYNHVAMAAWLHTYLVDLHVALEANDETFESPLWIATSRGHLDGLQWLVDLLARVDAAQVAAWVEFCLGVATRYRQAHVVEWLVPQVPSSSTLLQIYLSDDSDGTLLDAAVDAHAVVAAGMLADEVTSWSIEKLQHAFGKLDILKLDPGRTDALKQCLFQVVSYGSLALVPWLVGNLRPMDVVDVVCTQRALHRGLHRGGVPMLDLFEAQNILLPPEDMDDVLYSLLRQAADATSVPSWLGPQDYMTDENSSNDVQIAQWFVVRRGGKLAVLGLLLVRLAQRKKTTTQFKILYNAWLPLVDENEKNRVVMACLEKTNSPEIVQFFETVLATDPHLFVLMATTLQLGTVRKMHGFLAKSVSPDVLRSVESEALVRATLGGHRGIMEFLSHK
ncbi:Aste57867_24143 [Aphanomyces stellatus]|uniref:Aste57867_24143 protein n=1 Tax=Aphanomyces stellatus TaxID=120398 RepID=A0A485KFI9_9STRA|nr:hypothetical protein As57867_024069 [Aphanomyces stellatus]KAF0715284.1 hypothetical protein As57867_003442 [Aphanomyces stellatus]KAF0715298.1 hypothetical protein As57867_003456 [Aphanomyces stellatus]VFT80618.1 Aste57867_3452 [Aphanomyces stellatus]VFT80632.1 Aste57867_3466 [Aphanomyces stellatus]